MLGLREGVIVGERSLLGEKLENDGGAWLGSDLYWFTLVNVLDIIVKISKLVSVNKNRDEVRDVGSCGH